MKVDILFYIQRFFDMLYVVTVCVICLVVVILIYRIEEILYVAVPVETCVLNAVEFLLELYLLYI